MKYLHLIILFLLNSSFIFGQVFSYPTVKQSGEEIADFIPSGWHLLKSAKGDLNSDKNEDVVFVIQKQDSANIVEKTQNFTDTVFAQPRILLIAFHEKDKLNLIEQSNSFIISHSNPAMEEPFQTLNINDGMLEIGYQYFYNIGSWSITYLSYNFKYHNNKFYLLNAERMEFHRATHDYSIYNFDFSNKSWSSEKGNRQKEEEAVEEYHKKDIRKTRTLQSLNQPLTWEVAKDIYI